MQDHPSDHAVRLLPGISPAGRALHCLQRRSCCLPAVLESAVQVSRPKARCRNVVVSCMHHHHHPHSPFRYFLTIVLSLSLSGTSSIMTSSATDSTSGSCSQCMTSTALSCASTPAKSTSANPTFTRRSMHLAAPVGNATNGPGIRLGPPAWPTRLCQR